MNRLIDAGSTRATPHRGAQATRRTLSRAQVVVPAVGVALAVFLVAVFQLDPLVRWLWPVPVAFFVVYPYLKRVTVSHVAGGIAQPSRRSARGRR